ncbi:hypothetical protein AN640_07910 [Candidatus Epulonipiscium fishelsonii]|uniref:Uncharacterized protein n=1 Tax=Candidatus Epulonipiscium fishelsonii TaxID=77094 RepID=A0ACC8XEH3_9FIRM|nr:hypothetical protein AN640_07910 [Epulopiscium sp. SCG-D08WGA-EpuloA1]
MNDQAVHLRAMVESQNIMGSLRPFKVITVTSGKGGVGKSNFTANLSLALKNNGKSPIILDADFGLANIDLIFGQRPVYTLAHMLDGKMGIKDVLTQTQYGVPFISGGSGIKEMIFLKDFQLDMIVHGLSQLAFIGDTLLVDTGAGITDTVIKFSEMADEVCLVITPEPSSITDAYALVKTFIKELNVRPNFLVVVNRAESKEEAESAYRKIAAASKSFLGKELHYGGYIPFDNLLIKAIKEQKPIVGINSAAPSSVAYTNVARKMLNLAQQNIPKENLKERLKRVFKK